MSTRTTTSAVQFKADSRLPHKLWPTHRRLLSNLYCRQTRVVPVKMDSEKVLVSATVLNEKVMYAGYITVIRRQVHFASGESAKQAQSCDDDTAPATDPPGSIDQCNQCVNFDVAGHPAATFRCAVVFPYHPLTDQVTLVHEYAQGAGRYMYALPSGNFDPEQHRDVKQTAVFELEEEAHLTGGEWHELLPSRHPGIPEVKWCANAFTPFLCIGPEPHANAKPRDWVESVSGQRVECVSVARFRELIAGGKLLLPSIATGYMALDKLRELGVRK